MPAPVWALPGFRASCGLDAVLHQGQLREAAVVKPAEHKDPAPAPVWALPEFHASCGLDAVLHQGQLPPVEAAAVKPAVAVQAQLAWPAGRVPRWNRVLPQRQAS